jgi:hypothetical protein
MIIDFTVDSEYDLTVLADEGLSTGVNTNNSKAFVKKYTFLSDKTPGPVRSTMTKTF